MSVQSADEIPSLTVFIISVKEEDLLYSSRYGKNNQINVMGD